MPNSVFILTRFKRGVDGMIRTELSGASLTKENLVAASLGVSNEFDPESQTGVAQ